MSKQRQKIKGEFFPFYHKNWREGVEQLSPEQRGIYIDLLAAMWMRKAALPYDVGRIAKHIHVDVRILKRVLPTLISEDKIKLVDGFLTNTRMMQEILRYLKRTPSADTPESDEEEDAYEGTSRADVEEMSRTCGAAVGDLFGKSNEISTVGAIEVRTKNEEQEKDSQPASTVEQDPAGGRAGASPEIVILKSITDWTADESRARSWVTAHVGLYGLDVVRDAVAVVVAEIAAGRHVAQPVQLVSSVIRRLDARKPGPEERAHREAGTIPPWVADKSVRGKKISDVMAEFYADKARRMAEEAAA